MSSAFLYLEIFLQCLLSGYCPSEFTILKGCKKLVLLQEGTWDITASWNPTMESISHNELKDDQRADPLTSNLDDCAKFQKQIGVNGLAEVIIASSWSGFSLIKMKYHCIPKSTTRGIVIKLFHIYFQPLLGLIKALPWMFFWARSVLIHLDHRE